MRCRFVALTATLCLLVSALVLLGSFVGTSSVAQAAGNLVDAAEIRVCPVGPPDCDYAVIQDSVDAAGTGDVIKVATGVYSDVNNHGGLAQVVYISKTVTIQGGYAITNWTTSDPDANPTTLDAGGQGRVLYITGKISPTVEGLRITGGEAQGLGGIPWGADAGGGLYVITATALIRNNQIFSNTCSGFIPLGGGMTLWNSNATVSGNTFSHNIAGYGGGGLYSAWNHLPISDNLFTSNSAGYGGGGVFLTGGGTAFIGNILMSNTAEAFGGGLASEGGAQWLINNVIADNHAGSAGGALWSSGSKPHLYHSSIARNSAGDGSGIYVADTELGGLHSAVGLTNTILVDHAVGISVTGGSTVTVQAVLWYNTPITVSQSTTATVTVQNQHTGDPAFTMDGYHLTRPSAAIDMGVEVDVPFDIDGDLRPAGAGYDLGADELWFKIYLPLVLRDA